MSECVTCKGIGYIVDANGDRISRLSEGERCDNCGRPHCFDQIRVCFTVVTESGKEIEHAKSVDTEGDTPLEAINRILEEYDGPRGRRVKSIDRIRHNTTPLVSEGEDRKVHYERSGVIAHDITINFEK